MTSVLQLYDVCVLAESKSALLCVFVHVCFCVFVHMHVCGWGAGGTSGLFSLPLSFSAFVGL